MQRRAQRTWLLTSSVSSALLCELMATLSVTTDEKSTSECSTVYLRRR